MKTFLIISLLLIGLSIQAQTNTTPMGWTLGNPAPSTAQDIAKVFDDFGIHVNVTSIGSILFLVYFAAKLLRNKTALGQGAFGNILSSIVNLEAAATKPQPQNPAQPQQPPKP